MHVLITGANRGIGAALHDRYTARGDDVLGTHRDAPRDGWLQLDVTRDADIAALAERMQDATLDLLICNSGINTKDKDLENGYPRENWDATFAVNVTGVFLTIRACLPALRRAGGKIAIVSSQMASSEQAPGGDLIYRASKSAATNLARNLATDLAPEGIAVGCYHPGWVQTDMGGGSADLTTEQSADGLVARFDALSPETTGVFETWDGRPHPF